MTHTLPPDAELIVDADYNTFYLLADDTPPPSPHDGTIDELLDDQIAARPGLVCIATGRKLELPVTVHLAAGPDDDLDAYDHVTEAAITTASGRLCVMSVTDAEPQAELHLPPGSYRLRVYISGLASISFDGLDGDDHYRLTLWPGEDEQPAVLKRYPEFPGG